MSDRSDRRVEVDGRAEGVRHAGGDGPRPAVDQGLLSTALDREQVLDAPVGVGQEEQVEQGHVRQVAREQAPHRAVEQVPGQRVLDPRPSHPVGDGLPVPLVGPLGGPRRLDRHGPGHLVDPAVGPDEGEDGPGADLGDQAGVAMGLLLADEEMGPGDMGPVGADPELLGQPEHHVVVGRQPGPAPVDRGAVGQGRGPDPAPDAVPGLDDGHRPTGLVQPPRGRQSGVPGPHHADIDLHPIGHGRTVVLRLSRRGRPRRRRSPSWAPPCARHRGPAPASPRRRWWPAARRPS